MNFKQYEAEEKKLLEMVWKQPNIKQDELGRKMNKSSRIIRILVHQIRLKGFIDLGGKELYLVADNSGYDIVEKGSARFEMWLKRFQSNINEMQEIINKL